ncbi:MAG TPA: glycosyl transferase [Porphyromonadaceae bacterium]|nr:glycosyl transferase [Porphyromonadaceae bacterium]
MQMDTNPTPDYIFETSWEVCNKVGGIYTVLSTRANSLQKLYKDRLFFIGPDIWEGRDNPWFQADNTLYPAWIEYAKIHQGLEIRTGRWNVPGQPIVFLVKFNRFFEQRNKIYSDMWVDFGVDSMPAYGDYHDSSMFAYATGLVIESFYRYHQLEPYHVIAHFNEWMLGMGALYIKKNVPKIATVFTTHATSIGRSIAGNNLPLYNYLKTYNGDQMARQLNMTSKHSIEKKAAQNVDCFTTVSDITAQECAQFLERQPDVVTPNGFEKGFIPKGNAHRLARKNARKILLGVAEKLLGYAPDTDALLVGTSGRYEYKNKGIDVFIEAMNMLRKTPQLSKDIIAFIMVPAWIKGAREDLRRRIKGEMPSRRASHPGDRFITHELHQPDKDMVMQQIRSSGFTNEEGNRVKIIFIPSYLNGNDGIFDVPYYDLLIGLDLSVFPSYYEPWGYTPHESVAFSIPTITTTLAGFGLWAKKQGDKEGMDDGIEVIGRDDSNFQEVAKEIATLVFDFSLKSVEQINVLRQKASKLSDKGDWQHFIVYYEEAYRKALHNSFIRLSKPYKLNAD